MTWAGRPASPTLERAHALAGSGMYACIADLKDRLIREGHGVLEVLGLFSASAVARDIGQVIARSHRRQHQHSVQGLLLDG